MSDQSDVPDIRTLINFHGDSLQSGIRKTDLNTIAIKRSADVSRLEMSGRAASHHPIGYIPFTMIIISRSFFLTFIFAALIVAPSVKAGDAPLPGAPPSAYQPITGSQRASWFAESTIGRDSLMGGVISSAWGTMLNSPSEYGPHWDGFAKRYGMRLTGVSTGNAMEAGFGALWGEDPRYFREPDAPFKSRVGHIIKMTFLAQDRDGKVMPAYARYIAIPGNNFLSNTWRADSEATTSAAVTRTLTGFLGRMAGNAFDEFWPDVKQRLSRKMKHDKSSGD